MDTIALADDAWARLRWQHPTVAQSNSAWRAIMASMKYVGLAVSERENRGGVGESLRPGASDTGNYVANASFSYAA